MTQEELKQRVTAIAQWSSIRGNNINELYAVYRAITGNNSARCGKCPSVIKQTWNVVKNYYDTNYK